MENQPFKLGDLIAVHPDKLVKFNSMKYEAFLDTTAETTFIVHNMKCDLDFGLLVQVDNEDTPFVDYKWFYKVEADEMDKNNIDDPNTHCYQCHLCVNEQYDAKTKSCPNCVCLTCSFRKRDRINGPCAGCRRNPIWPKYPDKYVLDPEIVEAENSIIEVF